MDAMSMWSMAGSAFSTVTTGYFWLIRNRRERPNLRPHIADRDFYLGSGGAEARQIGLKLGLIVANYSLLPNALLGVSGAVHRSDSTWQPLQRLSFDAATPLPFNVPSMQTVLLRVNGYLTFQTLENLENGSKTLSAYLEHYLTEPKRFQIELRSLNNVRQVHVVTAG
jgi:hypothetical protein